MRIILIGRVQVVLLHAVPGQDMDPAAPELIILLLVEPNTYLSSIQPESGSVSFSNRFGDGS